MLILSLNTFIFTIMNIDTHKPTEIRPIAQQVSQEQSGSKLNKLGEYLLAQNSTSEISETAQEFIKKRTQLTEQFTLCISLLQNSQDLKDQKNLYSICKETYRGLELCNEGLTKESGLQDFQIKFVDRQWQEYVKFWKTIEDKYGNLE